MTTSTTPTNKLTYAQQIAAEAAKQRAIEEEEKTIAAEEGETTTTFTSTDALGTGQTTVGSETDPTTASTGTGTDSNTDTSEEFTPEGLLTQLPGGPTLAEIQAWRTQYDSIYVLPLRDDDWYVWRYLELREWREIQAQLGAVPPEGVEKFIQEKVLQACVVWPREKLLVEKESQRLPAGLIELLYEVIMAGSYFMAPEQALQRAIRL